MAQSTVRIISRYVLRQHLAPLAYALTALTCFLLIQQVAKQLGNLVGKGLPWGVIVDVFLLSIPFIVATTLPMAVLVAVLHAFSRLTADNEITAMKASGVSTGQLLWPVLAGAAVVSVLAFAWNDQVLPRANHSLRMLLVDIQRKKPSFSLREQVINEVLPGQFFLRAARIDPEDNTLKDVTIYDLEDAERRRIISAAHGRMAYTPGLRDLYLTLYDGDIRQVDRTDPTQFNRTFYHTNRIRVSGVGNTLERTENDNYRSDREMGICEMRQVVRDSKQEEVDVRREERFAVENDLRRLAGLASLPPLPGRSHPDSTPVGLYCRFLDDAGRWLSPRAAAAQVPTPRPHPSPPRIFRTPALPRAQAPVPPLISAGASASAASQIRGVHERRAMYEVEIQKKYALATACLVFALLGVPVAIRFARGGIGLVIAMSLGVFTIYYVGLIGGEELGNRQTISPFVAMWTANLLFSAVGLVALAVARRPGQSLTGGDWADVKSALFRWMRW
jgi:lipopolysaccharide export system permease protein